MRITNREEECTSGKRKMMQVLWLYLQHFIPLKRHLKQVCQNADINKISTVDDLSICRLILFEIFHNLKSFNYLFSEIKPPYRMIFKGSCQLSAHGSGPAACLMCCVCFPCPSQSAPKHVWSRATAFTTASAGVNVSSY